MSTVITSLEWIFRDIINHIKFLDLKKGLKLQLRPTGKMYIVSALMHNATACLYGNLTSNYFEMQPIYLAVCFQ